MFKILLCFLISAAWAQAKFELVSPPKEIVPELLEAGQTCIAESGADADIFTKLIQGTYSNDLTTKKFLRCFLVKGQYSDSDGYLVKEKILPVVGPHKKAKKFGKVIERCNKDARNVNYSDEYDQAFGLMNCLHKNSPLKLKLN